MNGQTTKRVQRVATSPPGASGGSLPESPPERVTVDGIAYVRAYPVADGRCAHCGRTMPHWTPARMIASAQAWRAKHGQSPSRASWKCARPEHPHVQTVEFVFGDRKTWSRFLRLCGLPPAPNGAPKMWGPEEMIGSLLDFRAREGRWPRKEDFNPSTPRSPHYSQVIREFGSWRAGIAAARGNERGPHLVAAAPLVEPVRGYLADGTSPETLADLSGVDGAVIRRLVKERKTFLREETAEALCLAIGREDLMVAAA